MMEWIGIAVNSSGNVLVAEQGGDVLVLDKNGKAIKRSEHGFTELRDVAVDKDDNIIYYTLSIQAAATIKV